MAVFGCLGLLTTFTRRGLGMILGVLIGVSSTVLLPQVLNYFYKFFVYIVKYL